MSTLIRSCLPALLLPLISVGAARAQGADLTGTWNLEAQAFLEVAGVVKGGVVADCEFEGSANISQVGADLSGDASLSLTSGGLACPPMVAGTLAGQVMGEDVEMGMMIAGMEQGTFDGAAVNALSAANGLPQVSALAGSFSITAGPFSGTTGNWNATRGLAPDLEIPTLGGAGLAATALLLLAAGAFLIGRRTSSAG